MSDDVKKYKHFTAIYTRRYSKHARTNICVAGEFFSGRTVATETKTLGFITV